MNTKATIAELKQVISDSLSIVAHTLKENRRILRDDEIFCDIGLSDGSVVFVNPQALAFSNASPNATTDPEQRFRVNPVLPPRSVGWNKEEVKSRVKALERLGFDRDECDAALCAAACNADRAVDYLLSGHIAKFPALVRV